MVDIIVQALADNIGIMLGIAELINKFFIGLV